MARVVEVLFRLDILADRRDVFPLRDRVLDLEFADRLAFGDPFDHDDGVGTLGERAAGVDSRGRPGGDAVGGRVPVGVGSGFGELQYFRRAIAGPEGIRGPDGVASIAARR